MSKGERGGTPNLDNGDRGKKSNNLPDILHEWVLRSWQNRKLTSDQQWVLRSWQNRKLTSDQQCCKGDRYISCLTHCKNNFINQLGSNAATCMLLAQ